ncbi:pyridoxal phosphate-dependent aminotransferase [bacterium]|nr:pyridoxal phosphate-dependent aminotransferase [candidate division CSSED10-310 bacterium]
MKLSARAVGLPASPIRKLVPFADAAKSRGIHVYHLNIGQPDIRTPGLFLDGIRGYRADVLAYGPSNGLLSYRQALCRYYDSWNIPLTPDEIFVTTAGSEALLFSIIAIADAGDNVIVMEPFYTNYNGFAAMVDVEVRGIPTSADDGFAVPASEKFLEKIDSRTRGILLCNPNNPTGAVYPESDLKRLVRLAEDHDLFIISDEVYREFTYGDTSHTSILQIPDLDGRAVMVDSVSKRYSACGARIGCIASRNRDILTAVMKMGQARLCPPTLEQLGASAAVDTPAEYFQRVISEYELRRDTLFGGLMEIDGVFCRKPDGAFYMMVTLPVDDSDRFCQYMLEDFELSGRTVMMAPGAGFYATPGLGLDQVRMAYVLKQEDLVASVEILREGLRSYSGG